MEDLFYKSYISLAGHPTEDSWMTSVGSLRDFEGLHKSCRSFAAILKEAYRNIVELVLDIL